MRAPPRERMPRGRGASSTAPRATPASSVRLDGEAPEGGEEAEEIVLAKRLRDRGVEADDGLRGAERRRMVEAHGDEARPVGVARDSRAQQPRRVVAAEPGKRGIHEDHV